jgi:hypothetical protein
MRLGGHLFTVDDFLPEAHFRLLVEEAAKCRYAALRVHIPHHKRGETVSYQILRNSAPQIVAFYQSSDLSKTIAKNTNVRVMPTPVRDQSSCSLLIYDHEGDHIGWHYDYNFYNGRHFTVLLPLINEHVTTERCSSAKLLVKFEDLEQEITTLPNKLIIFEGAHVYHRVTPLAASERRTVLSMTFCTDPTTTPMKDLERRIKDTAYFGLRALRT